MSLYLSNLRGKKDLVVACCVETLRHGKFTYKTVGTHQGHLAALMDSGIINRIPDTRGPFEYVAPAATIDWYHKHIDGSD
jgi:hypothetical protein